MLVNNSKITPDEIIKLFKEKQIDHKWSFKEYKQSDTNKWTHGYHSYPAKFIPQLVEKLINEYIFSKEAHINDPFMGSGTTIVTAISRGFKASGTDINKLAYLITKVKATPIDPQYLNKKINSFFITLNFLGNKIEPFIPSKNIERINYWFAEKSRIQLGRILRLIYEEDDEVIKDFFRVGFSNILKNCSLWSQRSTKPTRDLNKKPCNPYFEFQKQLKKMQTGNESFYKIVPENVKKNLEQYLNIRIGDAREQPVPDDSVDLIITSSPYVTSYEYADLHQLSTIWLELADNLTEYKKSFIGTSHKIYENKEPESEIGRTIVNELSKKNEKMAREVSTFFIDMQEVLNESFRILKKGGRACYVIGNTTFKSVSILNAEVFAESLQIAGFKLDKIIKREIPLKILPQKRDEKTGRFANNNEANIEAYPFEYIVIGEKV